MEPKWMLKLKLLLKNAGNSCSRRYEIQRRAFPQCAEVRTVKKCASLVPHTQRLLSSRQEQLRLKEQKLDGQVLPVDFNVNTSSSR